MRALHHSRGRGARDRAPARSTVLPLRRIVQLAPWRYRRRPRPKGFCRGAGGSAEQRTDSQTNPQRRDQSWRRHGLRPRGRPLNPTGRAERSPRARWPALLGSPRRGGGAVPQQFLPRESRYAWNPAREVTPPKPVGRSRRWSARGGSSCAAVRRGERCSSAELGLIWADLIGQKITRHPRDRSPPAPPIALMGEWVVAGRCNEPGRGDQTAPCISSDEGFIDRVGVQGGALNQQAFARQLARPRPPTSRSRSARWSAPVPPRATRSAGGRDRARALRPRPSAPADLTVEMTPIPGGLATADNCGFAPLCRRRDRQRWGQRLQPTLASTSRSTCWSRARPTAARLWPDPDGDADRRPDRHRLRRRAGWCSKATPRAPIPISPRAARRRIRRHHHQSDHRAPGSSSLHPQPLAELSPAIVARPAGQRGATRISPACRSPRPTSSRCSRQG